MMPNIPQREEKEWNFGWGTDLLTAQAGDAAAPSLQGTGVRAAPALHSPSFSKDNVAAASIFPGSQTPS